MIAKLKDAHYCLVEVHIIYPLILLYLLSHCPDHEVRASLMLVHTRTVTNCILEILSFKKHIIVT